MNTYRRVFFILFLLSTCAVIPMSSYAGFRMRGEAPGLLYTNQAIACSNSEDGSSMTGVATHGSFATELTNASNFGKRKYSQGAGNGKAFGAFAAGLVGLGLMAVFLLSFDFFVSNPCLLWTMGLLIAIAGSAAFFDGRDVLREGAQGRGWAVTAMILGCITIIPPTVWLCLYIDETIDRWLGIKNHSYHPYHYHHNSYGHKRR